MTFNIFLVYCILKLCKIKIEKNVENRFCLTFLKGLEYD